MDLPAPRYRWQLRSRPIIGPAFMAAGQARGLSRRLLEILAARGHADAYALTSFLDDPAAGLHDPALLPDAGAFAERIERARLAGERVLVFGDFDADGLTGLAILVTALRRLGIAAESYVPSRSDEGHGLSLLAVARARETGCSTIVTVDCGSSSLAEIEASRQAGLDVLVTDHHQLPPRLPRAAALVNPHRSDSIYPDSRLAGSGVAFKLAQLLLGDAALDLADLAAIGTVADVAPIAGENRSIVRLGLERLRRAPRPGLAALLERAGLAPDKLDLDRLAYQVAPRLNAVGRVGDASLAAELLLCEEPGRAAGLAEKLEAANLLRRELLAGALLEARKAVEAEAQGALIIVAGDWPVGIIGLVAGRLAEEAGRPAVVFSTGTSPWRGSGRSPAGFDLAASFGQLADLFERYGGHAAAAGCELVPDNYAAFRERLSGLAGTLAPSEPQLLLDISLPALEVDYGLLRELTLLEPAGVGNPAPLVGVAGLGVARVRPANGGHTQLVLRKGREVLDGICFGRDDLPGLLREGDEIDVVARLASRVFGGFETLQLEIRDVGPAGTLARLQPAEPLLVA